MTRSLTGFVKVFIALVFVISSFIPLYATAAPIANNQTIPVSASLMSNGQWICDSVAPAGWIITEVQSRSLDCSPYQAIYIEPLVDGQSYRMCAPEGGVVAPSGWVNTAVDNRSYGCYPYYGYDVEPLVSGWSYKMCSAAEELDDVVVPPGWYLTGYIDRSSFSCDPFDAYSIRSL